MKKKLLVVFMAISMAVSVVACGHGEGVGEAVVEKDNGNETDSEDGTDTLTGELTMEENSANSAFATIKINGNKYDLTGDFKEVVGRMVKDGNCVVYNWTGAGECYDENGEQTSDAVRTDDWYFAAVNHSRLINVNNETKALQVKTYQLANTELNWETSFGITNNSAFSDVETLEGYVKYCSWTRRDWCSSVYMDGENIDMEELEKEYEAFVDYWEEEGVAKAMEQYFPLSDFRELCPGVYSNSGVVGMMLNNNDISKAEMDDLFEQKGYSFKNETLLALAIQKAGQALNSGEIDSYKIITFEKDINEDDIAAMYYWEYYYE